MLLLGHFILVSLAMAMLLAFLYLFRREFYFDNSRIMLLMILMLWYLSFSLGQEN
jgi:hypothetical protein